MERTLIAILALAAIVAGIQVVRVVLEQAKARRVARLRADPGLATQPLRILYFTTPECAECRLRQEPALRELARRFGPSLVVDKRDAIEEAALAKQYGVRTVPTTAVFGGDGALVQINYGFASPERLAAQLAGSALA
jgi:thioredoxin 1